jgi:hypothetical protein
MTLRPSVLMLMGLALAQPSLVGAQCTTNSDARAVQKAARIINS